MNVYVYIYDDYADNNDHKGDKGVAKKLNHRYNPRSIHKIWRQLLENREINNPKRLNPNWGRRRSAEEREISPNLWGLLGQHHKHGRQPYREINCSGTRRKL
jgi:hypothetical protein